MFEFLGLKKAVGELAAERNKLKSSIEALQRRREELAFMPAHKDDVIEMLEKWIDAEKVKYPKTLEASLAPYFRKPLDATEVYPRGVELLTASPANIACTFNLLQANMLFFFGDQIKEGLRKAVYQMTPSANVPRLAERTKEIEKLDKEIAQLQEQERKIIEEAHAVGIRI